MAEITRNHVTKSGGTSPYGQLSSIHGLRALAALLVVFHHGREQINSFAATLPTQLGTGGVDIFFVISGLVMILSTEGREMSRVEFLLHRIKRVVPLYWFVTFLTVAIVIAAPNLMKNTSFSLSSLIQSYPVFNVLATLQCRQGQP